MGMPSDKELNRMRKILANVEGTRIVGKKETKVEKFKFKICQTILGFYQDSKMTQKEFAIFLSLDEAHVSKLLNCKVEVFTIDRLLKLLEVVQPDYEIKLA